MTNIQLIRLNRAVDILYRSYKGEKPNAIAKVLGLSRKSVYAIREKAELDQRVVKSVEQRIGNEMREEDQAYGRSS